jgi:hypothetical protein
VNSAVSLIVEIFRVVEHQAVTGILTEVLTVEIEVPGSATIRYHKEAQEFVRQNHLRFFVHSLVVIRIVRVHLSVLLRFSPLKACLRWFVYT